STLMRVLSGLVQVAEGSAQVLGQAPFGSPEVRQRIAFVPATECFYENLSGRRNLEIAFLSHGYDRENARERAARALDLVGMTDDADRRHGTWSRGMRQRLKLGFALVSDVDVVLLDEPFMGVDPPSRKFLRNVIHDLGTAGRTILVSSHVLYEVEMLTDRVGILAHGRLLGFGRVSELLADLRDRHPHRIRIASQSSRELAVALMKRGHVSAIDVDDSGVVEFVTTKPQVAYRELAAVVKETGVVIRCVETLDDGLEAVFRHITAAGARRL
ncbi:ABC transporter ATP-binding protein, partial [Candidatus Eisenbacteria bacterium]